MVKLAQHIQWHSQLPSEADGRAQHKGSGSDLLPNARPRKTLAELFQSTTATSSSSSSFSSSSSSGPSVAAKEKLSVVYHRNPPASSPAATKSPDFGVIKRSSSAKKISDLGKNQNTQIYPSSKIASKSGPLLSSNPEHLLRNPSTHSSNSKQSRRNSSALLSNGGFERNPLTNSSDLEQKQRDPSTNLSNSEHRQRSPSTISSIHERNQKNPSTKSGDFQHNLKNPSTKSSILKQNEREKKSAAEQINGHVQGTPTKGKKFRKGIFSLQTDFTSEVRNSGSPQKISDGPGKHDGSRESKRVTAEIPDKMVGLAWLDAKPLLLSSGNYSFPSEGFVLEQVVSEKSSFVKHGSLHRVRIREGHLGVAWVDGKAVLLEAGVSIHSCPPGRFSYVATDDKLVSEKEFVLGPFRVVTVHDCEVGIKFCNRQPQILYSGRHCLSISRVEVFAGFESLLRRQSNVSGVSAMSNDDMRVSADMWVEWQIKPEDAAAARLANITDVEGALCDKVRRAFNLVIWEVNAQDMKLQLMGGAQNSLLQANNQDPHPLLKTLSSDICRECMDLFEEGWSVTLWDLQLSKLVILPEVKNKEDIHKHGPRRFPLDEDGQGRLHILEHGPKRSPLAEDGQGGTPHP